MCVSSFWRCPFAAFLLCIILAKNFPLDILKNENIMRI